MSSVGDEQIEDSVKDQINLLNESMLSDEHIDPYCELCVKDKKRRIAAVGLCKECNTFVCQQCLDAHSKWPGMRNHTVLQGDDMPRTQAEKPVKFPDCVVHKETVNDWFCLNHRKMLCSQCMKVSHGMCKGTAIHELCKTLDIGDVRKFRELLQNSTETANLIKLRIQQNKDVIERQRQTMIQEAEDFKKRLTTKIQSMNVDDLPITELCKIKAKVFEGRVEATVNAIQSLQDDISFLLTSSHLDMGWVRLRKT